MGKIRSGSLNSLNALLNPRKILEVLHADGIVESEWDLACRCPVHRGNPEALLVVDTTTNLASCQDPACKTVKNLSLVDLMAAVQKRELDEVAEELAREIGYGLQYDEDDLGSPKGVAIEAAPPPPGPPSEERADELVAEAMAVWDVGEGEDEGEEGPAPLAGEGEAAEEASGHRPTGLVLPREEAVILAFLLQAGEAHRERILPFLSELGMGVDAFEGRLSIESESVMDEGKTQEVPVARLVFDTISDLMKRNSPVTRDTVIGRIDAPSLTVFKAVHKITQYLDEQAEVTFEDFRDAVMTRLERVKWQEERSPEVAAAPAPVRKAPAAPPRVVAVKRPLPVEIDSPDLPGESVEEPEGGEGEELLQTAVPLSPSASKRLIALGLFRQPALARAFEEGVVAVAKGSTTTYFVEEALGVPVERQAYVRSISLPPRHPARHLKASAADVVFRRGRPWRGISLREALESMGPRDVLLMGANAMNYERGVAGLLMGESDGGLLGRIWTDLLHRRVHWIVPCGLEKEVAGDLNACFRASFEGCRQGADCPVMAPLPGRLFTEIEALDLLFGVKARHLASGGIGGREGGVWLLVRGTVTALDRMREGLAPLLGERPFLDEERTKRS